MISKRFGNVFTSAVRSSGIRSLGSFAFDRFLSVKSDSTRANVLMRVTGRAGGQCGASCRCTHVLFLVLLAQLIDALFRVLANAFGSDALATLAHVRTERSLLLLLAKWASILGGFPGRRRFADVAEQFCLSACAAVCVRVVPPLLLLLLLRLGHGIVQRILERTVRELLVVPVNWTAERRVLDAVTHVVNIHGCSGCCCQGYEDAAFFTPANDGSLKTRRERATRSFELN